MQSKTTICGHLPHWAKSLCRTCYNRSPKPSNIPTTCGHKPHWAKGLCRKCYRRSYQRPPRQEANRQWRIANITPTYDSWVHMRQRCSNPNYAKWHRYGGRGITVCARWDPKQGGSFANFLADMGERPEGRTLDRWPNPDGNYEPGNCRWATPKEQRANQRKSF